MLTPSLVMTETDRLGALLEVLRNPDKYKAQIDELRQLSKDAEDKNKALTEQMVAYQNVQNEITESAAEADAAIGQLTLIMAQATSAVQQALDYRADAESRVAEIVKEARVFLTRINQSAQEASVLFKEETEVQEAQILKLDREIANKTAVLEGIEKKLDALRESVGGI